jgi:hypothetical protein
MVISTGFARDFSNYTHDAPPDAVQKYRDAGVTRIITQSIKPWPQYPPSTTLNHIDTFKPAGFDVQAYVWLWFTSGVDDINRKLDLIEGKGVWAVWLDVEDIETVGPTRDSNELRRRADIVWQCLNAIWSRGYATGIYTGKWYWDAYMGGMTEFADAGVRLWAAQYGDYSFEDFISFGGWTLDQLDMLQYAAREEGDGIMGAAVDFDLYRLPAPDVAPPAPVEQPAPVEITVQVPIEATEAPPPPEISPRLRRRDEDEQAVMKALLGNDAWRNYQLVPLAEDETTRTYRYLLVVPFDAVPKDS